MQTDFIITSVLMTLAVILYLCFCADNLLNFRGYRVGYTASNIHVCGPHIETILSRYVEDTSETILVEAGAGLATMTRYLARRHTWRRCIALEIRPHLILIARLLNLSRRAPIEFEQGNILSFDFPHDAVVYSYLSTPIIEKLYKDGHLKGCLFISLTFTIPGVKATEEIRMPTWQRRISVYDFR